MILKLKKGHKLTLAMIDFISSILSWYMRFQNFTYHKFKEII